MRGTWAPMKKCAKHVHAARDHLLSRKRQALFSIKTEAKRVCLRDLDSSADDIGRALADDDNVIKVGKNRVTATECLFKRIKVLSETRTE